MSPPPLKKTVVSLKVTEIIMTALTLSFHDMQFDVIDRNNQPWLRLHQIEGALGYAGKGRAL